jgi:hypothetical protein
LQISISIDKAIGTGTATSRTLAQVFEASLKFLISALLFTLPPCKFLLNQLVLKA